MRLVRDRHADAAGSADAASGTADGSPKAATTEAEPDDVYRVQLVGFEGPLDLLLHLIRSHELDIRDIPVGFVTEKYLEYLAMMRGLHIDVASEYLLMAATLVHIKSKMLVPNPREDDSDNDEALEELDPRAELVRRLLEYQKYKDAAAQLGDRGALGTDVFERGTREPESPGPAPFAPVNVFKLFDAFSQILKRTNIKADHQILFERVSIAERIVELTELLHRRVRSSFEDLFEGAFARGGGEITRLELVATFLALLEMCRLRIVRVVQDDTLAPIHVELAATDGDSSDGGFEGAPHATVEPADAGTATVAPEGAEHSASPSEAALASGSTGAEADDDDHDGQGATMSPEAEPIAQTESAPEAPAKSEPPPAPGLECQPAAPTHQDRVQDGDLASAVGPAAGVPAPGDDDPPLARETDGALDAQPEAEPAQPSDANEDDASR